MATTINVPKFGAKGTKAYINTVFCGLVPCRVIEVREPWRKGDGVSKGRIEVEVTAARPGYVRGEIVEVAGCDLIPREVTYRRSGRVYWGPYIWWKEGYSLSRTSGWLGEGQTLEVVSLRDLGIRVYWNSRTVAIEGHEHILSIARRCLEFTEDADADRFALCVLRDELMAESLVS